MSTLEVLKRLFLQYKGMGDKTFMQLTDAEINWQYNTESNSVAIIVRHLSGNMLSRFTDFLSTDGEKPWRNRDQEFEGGYASKAEMIIAWEAGWKTLFETINMLDEKDLQREVFIRQEKHTVFEALERQLAHYASHVGQIVFVGKMLKGKEWTTLSIPRGGSAAFNEARMK